MPDRWVAVDMFTGEIVTDSIISKVVLKHREIVAALSELCDMLPPMGGDGHRCWNRMTKSERGILNRCAKQLHEASATIDQIAEFSDWWYSQDWRGREKNQLPGPWDVIKNWSRYLNWAEGTEQGKTEWGAALDRQKSDPNSAYSRLMSVIRE